MNIIYKIYEPNKGLEEFQAQLYNQANHRIVTSMLLLLPKFALHAHGYNQSNDRIVTAKEIQDRFEYEKIDPNTVRYAFTENNKPLAYVQARDYPLMKEIHIGYPWAMPDCPVEVQNKIHKELIDYIKSRDTDLKIKMYTQDNRDHKKLALNAGFHEEGRRIRFEINLNSIAKFDTSKLNFTMKKAEIEDIDNIKKCYYKALGDLVQTNDEAFENMLKKTIERGFMQLAYENNELIGACSPIPPEDNFNQNLEPYLQLRPIFTLIGKEEALVVLMKKAIKIGINENWKKETIRIGFKDENPKEMDVLYSISQSYLIGIVIYGL